MRFIASSDKELCRRKRAEEHGERVAWNTVQYHESKQNRQKKYRTLRRISTKTL